MFYSSRKRKTALVGGVVGPENGGNGVAAEGRAGSGADTKGAGGDEAAGPEGEALSHRKLYSGLET